jgi:hypothetical protein
MAYKIQPYTLRQAERLGVTVRPSTLKGKKIDVFKSGKKVASVGAMGYGDYPTFQDMERKGLLPSGFAESRRKAYKSRHEKNRKRKGTAGFYADQLLW